LGTEAGERRRVAKPIVVLEGFRHIQRFRVAFRDIDMMQHANHTAYVRWAEAQRSDYFIENFHDVVNGDRGMILVRIDFVYERQIRLREQIAMGCRIARVGTRSFDFAYEVWSEDAGARCATGVTTMVAYNYPAEASISVPSEWREAIRAYEIQKPAGI
jgi:acyl-CoA thioester hydrolase